MRSAANAYARAAHSALSPREAESAVLIKAAQQLQAIKDDWANQADGLNRALGFNQKVWTIIAGAAAEPDSPLPAEIKRGVADLSIFVFRRMVDTMVEPSADKLGALISINQNLAAGLSARAA
ncbi:flagellar biosynthesis regulator FlaF [Methylobacterium sp. sgz302541]|uniref:flagellar biosynthesis regulator FlaF n=1 Tax=unclassified Methylobacterium TaxID=2615210 RepID=UPI003D3533AB